MNEERNSRDRFAVMEVGSSSLRRNTLVPTVQFKLLTSDAVLAKKHVMFVEVKRTAHTLQPNSQSFLNYCKEFSHKSLFSNVERLT